MKKISKEEIISTIKKRWWVVPIELLVIAIILVADQLSKKYAFLTNEDELIPGLFNLLHEYNTGGGWSIFSDNMLGLSIVTTIVVIGLSIYLLIALKESEWLRVSIVFIIGGGIGNLIDRYSSLFGNVDYFGVRDFIQFAFWEEFPVFNVADSFVVIGAFMLIIVLLVMMFQESKKSQKEFEAKQKETVTSDSEEIKDNNENNI